jgi:hypothetical protein
MGITQQIGASSLIKPGVIDNAAARPASPYEGQVIYQKDTDAVLVWNGTAWYPNWNLPWGIVDTTSGGTSSRGYIFITASQTVNAGSATVLTNSSMTFSGIAGRLYRATLSGYASSTSASGLATLLCRDSADATVSQWVINMTNTGGGGGITAVNLFTAAGSVTRKWVLSSTTGNNYMGGATTPIHISIEDIGPA